MTAARGAFALLVAVVLGACTNDDPSTVAAPPVTASSTSTAGEPPADGGAPPTTATPAPGDPTPEKPTSSGALPGPPGSAADRLLRSEHLLLQVLVEEGSAPRATTIDHVITRLTEARGSSVETTRDTVSGPDVWSSDDLRVAARERVPRVADDTAVLQLLFVHGRHDQGDGVLGISIGAGVAAVFVDRVDAAATPLVGAGRIEQAVTLHEVGHLLGLVDLFLRTGRADPDHPGHSPNRQSVMYWAVESSLVADILTGGPPVDFDAEDRADLRAIRDG